MANPDSGKPSFALITNGDEMLLVKLDRRRYELSRVFSPLVAAQELETVYQVLKYLGRLMSA
jgi:hypothetical protein